MKPLCGKQRARIGMRMLLWFPLACAGTGSADAGDREEALNLHFADALERSFEQKDYPALSVVVFDDTGIRWTRRLGHADLERTRDIPDEALYRVGSVTKIVTALALMRLAEAGRVDLDAPVIRYVPAFSPENPFDEPIRVRHLLAHEAGLVREPLLGHYFDRTSRSLEEVALSLNETSLVAPPGALHKYSNAGFAVAGYVVEQVTGRPFARAVEELVLEPAGMSTSAFELTDRVRERLPEALMTSYDGVPFPAPVYDLGEAPAGNLYTTLDDLAKLGGALLRSHRAGSPFSRESLETLWTLRPPSRAGGRSYGLGFVLGEIEGERAVGHSGAVYGFSASLKLLPSAGIGVALVGTVDQSNPTIDRLADYALEVAQAAPDMSDVAPFRSSDPIDEDLQRRLAGYYRNGRESIFLRRWKGRLFLESKQGAAEVRRRGSEWLLDDVRSYDEALSVDVDEQTVELRGRKFEKARWARPAPPTAEMAERIGHYGWVHDYIRVYEWDGRLHARVEWKDHVELEKLGPDQYAFPQTGTLYPRERLIFLRDADDQIVAASLSGIRFPRRDFGEALEAQIQANVRESDTLRRNALAVEPPHEAGEFREPDLVDLASLGGDIEFDIRYASTNNFMGMPFYAEPRAFLQRPAARALDGARKWLGERGFGLLVFDSYRPWFVTRMFWDATPPSARAFVADPSKGSRHNRGSAVDLTLYDLETGRQVVMTGGYDDFTARSTPGYMGGTSLQRWHRELLREAMERHGFEVYEWEWWHFDHEDWRAYPILNLEFSEIR